jgi:hypothetical protein
MTDNAKSEAIAKNIMISSGFGSSRYGYRQCSITGI